MRTVFLVTALLVASAASFADAPGSRIRAGPLPPQPKETIDEKRRCETLREEAKERCLKDERAAAAAEERKRGPEATGAGSGAGSGAASGTSGGGTFGGSAPR
jgi:hypothetical protein